MKIFFALLLTGSFALAQQPMHALASNGMKAVIDDLRAQCERTAGAPVDLVVGTSTLLKDKIAKGEAFEFVVITTEVANELATSGKIDPATKTNLARAGIGVGVKKGVAMPKVGTAEEMKKALLAAKYVTYASAGASRPSIEKMFEKLGIAAAMAPKIKMPPSSTEAAQQVVDGQADILLTLISEIIPVKGMALAGPLPADFQTYVSFTAGVSPQAKNAKAAKAFVQCLAGPASAASVKANGMEQVK